MSNTDSLTLVDLTSDSGRLDEAIDHMLRNVQLLDREGDQGGALESPSQGVALIEAGMTWGAKTWTSIIGGLGGAGALWAGTSDLWDAAAGGERIAAMLGVAAVLVSAILSVAWILSADLKARGTAAAATYRARADLTARVLSVAEKNRVAGLSASEDVDVRLHLS